MTQIAEMKSRNEYHSQWREANREHLKAYKREWRAKNKDKVQASNKRYQERLKSSQ